MNNVGQNGNEVGDAVAAEGAANILTVFRVVKSLGFFFKLVDSEGATDTPSSHQAEPPPPDETIRRVSRHPALSF